MNLNNYIDKFPFEFCATRFLRQWESRERELHSSISTNPTAAGVIKALRYFQVARNFKGLKHDSSISEKILNALILIKDDMTLTTPIDKVNKLAAVFLEDFKQFNISSASKLFWLSYRYPYVIYDSRAVKALKRAGCRNIKDYSSYVSAWRGEFLKMEVNIGSAIQHLPFGRRFMPYTPLSDDDLVSYSKELWFKERVFDIFLWEIGGQK